MLASLKANLRKKLIIYLIALLPSISFSHPHSWIDTHTYFNSNDTHITALNMTWTFDQETSDYMLHGEDTSAEAINHTLQLIAETVVNNMYNDHYFTYLYHNETPVRYKKARYPQLIQAHDKLVLSFEIPLSEPIPFKENNFKLFIYDASYYVDMSWINEADIQLSDNIKDNCLGRVHAPQVTDQQRDDTLALAEDVAPDNALGQLFSQQFQLSCN